jgi:hypothetical protein
MKTVISKDRTPIAFDRSKERSSMNNGVLTRDIPEIEAIGALLAMVAAAATLLLLISLHILSPEFDPSFRMVSEYALGRDAWVLSLMFLAWGMSSWALALAIWSQVKTKAGKVGLWFLVIAGLGEAMASIFAQATGGHLPQQAPTQLPAGVLGLDGWADRLIVLSNCLWVFVVAWQAMKLTGRKERNR